ncbi:MAG: hypothetical protein ABI700_11835 [Chloroflexota bacterium]
MSNQLQPNTARSLWDKVLFAYPFQITVNKPLQACLDLLSGLSQPSSGFLKSLNRTVQLQKTDEESYKFKIRVNRYGGGAAIASVKCTGVVFRDSLSDRTVIKAKMTVAKYVIMTCVYVLLLTFFMPLFLHVPFPYSIGFLLLCTVSLGVLWLQVRSDYRKLQALIDDAFPKN